MGERDFRIVSVDDHLVQPPDLWQSRLPNRFRERGPKVARGAGGDRRLFLSRFGLDTDLGSQADEDEEAPAGDAWVYDGQIFPTTGSSVVGDKQEMTDFTTLLAFRYDDLPDYFVDPVARTQAMDDDGVLASVCFPMSEFPRFCGQSFLEGEDKDLGLACIRAYNDFMVEEWCAAAPGRYVPLVLVPLWDAQLAAEEIRRTAAMGAKAIAFTEDPFKLGLPSLHDPDRAWDPLFDAAQETGMPLCTHIGSASWTPPGPPEQPFTVGLANTTTLSTLAFYEWILSDVFVRFPRVRLVLSEGGIGWIPHAIEHADYVWHRHGRWTGSKLPEPPSHYFPEHVFGCFIDDEFGAAHVRDIGISNIMLETDFPHADSSWPNTQKMARERLDYLNDDELALVTRGNAERVFDFEVVTSP